MTAERKRRSEMKSFDRQKKKKKRGGDLACSVGSQSPGVKLGKSE